MSDIYILNNTTSVCIFNIQFFLDELVGFAHFLLLLLKAMPPFTRQKVVSFLNGFFFFFGPFSMGDQKFQNESINFGWVFLFCFF